MDAQALIQALAAKGVTLVPDGDSLIARPRERLTDADRDAIRQRKADLIAHLRASAGSCREHNETSDSRHPLIEPAVRAKLEAIEVEARAKGWPPELLFNCGYWDQPRGLAAVLDADDEVVEITGEAITILKTKRDLLKFRRHIERPGADERRR